MAAWHLSLCDTMASRFDFALQPNAYNHKGAKTKWRETGVMRVSRKIYSLCVFLCAMAATVSFFRTTHASTTPQASWTLDNVLKQMDAQAATFHSLTADLERTKVT